MNYAEETNLLYLHGLHLEYDPEDAAEYPQDHNESGEIWRLGTSETYFTRAEALAYVKERQGGS